MAMSRTQHLADLCTLLVKENYGELTARIFALLCRRGRQPIDGILKHTRLTPRQVRHALVVLHQQNLVYHNTDKETGVTFYEANQDAAYYLLRNGRILDIVSDRYGDDARYVLVNILDFGRVRISDLHEAITEAKQKESTKAPPPNGVSNGINGHSDNDSSSVFPLGSILAQLLDDGILEPVVANMFRSPTDTYNEVEKKIIRESYGGSIKGAKQGVEVKGRVSDTLRAIREESQIWKKGSKRLNGDYTNGVADKKRKLANGQYATNGSVAELDDPRLDPKMIIRVNYEKCTVMFRNQRIVKVAEDDIGEITAQVYDQALRLAEEKIQRCRPDPFIDEFDDGNDVTVSTMEVSQVLSPSINVAGGIGKASSGDIDLKSLNRTMGKRKREDEAEVEGEASADESEDDIMDNGIPSPEASGGKLSRATKVTFQDQPLSAEDRQGRMGQVKNHLNLLGAHSHHLLTKAGSRGLGEWQIEYNKIVEYMKEVELDNYICQTFGRQGLRVSRILREHGKLDEKQIQKIGLMKQKEIRTKLVELQMAGYADVQEVPKDNNRTPNRTIFLWWFDVERVMVLHLDRIYKALANCIRRLEVERFEAADMLELTRRTDVMGHEDEMLTMEQLTRLGGFREKEDRLINEVSRLDELVGIFKEF